MSIWAVNKKDAGKKSYSISEEVYAEMLYMRDELHMSSRRIKEIRRRMEEATEAARAVLEDNNDKEL